MSHSAPTPKRSCSKQKLIANEGDQSPTSAKTKANKGNILSTLFGKGKTKKRSNSNEDSLVDLEQDVSITCLYANSNLAEGLSCTNFISSSEINKETTPQICTVKASRSQPNINELIKSEAVKCHSMDRRGDHLKTSPKSKKESIFHKFKRKSNEEIAKTQHDETTKGNGRVEKVRLTKGSVDLSQYSALYCVSPDLSTLTALREILDFSARLQDSEYHLIQIFGKYIKDEALGKELVEIVSTHTKLQIDAERRAQALASDMWKQQTDIYKSQESTLSENLREMVRQNRKLQEENELLIRKMERMHSQPVINVQNATEGPNGEENNLCVIDRLHKSNERLRGKVSEVMQQMNELEGSLLIERERCATLEEQFRNCFSEVQTQKAQTQTMKRDFHLELTNAKHQLDKKDERIKDSEQSVDAVFDEIQNAKRKLPMLFKEIGWEQLKDLLTPNQAPYFPTALKETSDCLTNQPFKKIKHITNC